MHLINKTHYRTDDLRRFALAGLRAEGMNPRWQTVTFVSGRSRWGDVHGRAWIGSPGVRMMIPTQEGGRRIEVFTGMRCLAQVYVHELGHNRGLRHTEMDVIDNIEVPWVDGLTIRAAAPVKKPKRDLVAERADHAGEMLATWAAKAKRAETRRKYWARKARYYKVALEARAAKKAAGSGMGEDEA